MLIGHNGAGKTSLKKSFLGQPFDPDEESTDGIEVDRSKFKIDVDQVKDWQSSDETPSVSQFTEELARMLVRKVDAKSEKKPNLVVQANPTKCQPLKKQVGKP